MFRNNDAHSISVLAGTPRSVKKVGKLKRRAETPSSAIKNKIIAGKENAMPNEGLSSANPKARKMLRAANENADLSIDQGLRNRVPRQRKIDFVSPKSSIPRVAIVASGDISNARGLNNTRITRAQSKRNAAELTSCNTFIAANSSVSTPQRGTRATRQQQAIRDSNSMANSRLMTPVLARQRKEEEEKKKLERLISSTEKAERAVQKKQAFLKSRQDSIRQAREKFKVTGFSNKKDEPKAEEKRKVDKIPSLAKKLAAPRVIKPPTILSKANANINNKSNDSANQSNQRKAGCLNQIETKKITANKAENMEKKTEIPPLSPPTLSPIPQVKPNTFTHELPLEDKVDVPNSSFLAHSDNNNPAAFSHLFSPIIDPKRQAFNNFKSPIIPEIKPVVAPRTTFDANASSNATSGLTNNVTYNAQQNTFSLFAAPSNAGMSITNFSSLPKTPTKTALLSSADISSYQMTPPPPDVSNYDISAFVASDEEEEHQIERAGKKIPRWAQKSNFLKALRAQFTMSPKQLEDTYNKAFGPYPPEVPVPVDEMGITIRNAYRVRTSSVNWNHPKP